jgi:hypothetical protein
MNSLMAEKWISCIFAAPEGSGKLVVVRKGRLLTAAVFGD